MESDSLYDAASTCSRIGVVEKEDDSETSVFFCASAPFFDKKRVLQKLLTVV